MRHSLYLACKEALHNIVKHAGASEVSIRLDLAEDGFTLAIEDDGLGFAAAHLPARGNGLVNMRQRLKELHGVCRVESTPGRGTRVLFSLPHTLNNNPSALRLLNASRPFHSIRNPLAYSQFWPL